MYESMDMLFISGVVFFSAQSSSRLHQSRAAAVAAIERWLCAAFLLAYVFSFVLSLFIYIYQFYFCCCFCLFFFWSFFKKKRKQTKT